MIDFINALASSITGKHTTESLRRSNICAQCPEKSKKFYAAIVNAEIKDVQGYACDRCACPIATKVFAKDKNDICTKW
jgi:hypothetical protein